MNIILIGMPGAGKSTIGVILAKILGKNFIDTDLIIQEREGMLLQDLINKYGMEQFLDFEKKAILNLDAENTIIATGGSVIYREEAMNYLKKLGCIIYLQLSYETINSRINNITTRGIAMDKNKSLEDIYLERISLYKKYADVTIDCNNSTVEQAVERIMTKILKN